MHVDLLSILKKIVKKVYWNSKWYQGVRISITSNVSIKSEFEAPCQIHSDVVYRGRMGMGSYIACGSILSADIGRFTSIGAFVRSTAGRHPYQSPFATTSPCFFHSIRSTTNAVLLMQKQLLRNLPMPINCAESM